MKKSALVIAAAAATLISFAAEAQKAPESGFYVGGALGKSSFKDGCRLTGSCEDTDTAIKLFGGYQINRNFAGEFGYVDLGRARSTAGGATDEFKAKAFELSGLGSVPVVERFSVFGRFGLYFADAEENTNFQGDSTHSNNDLTYGVGVRYDITRNLGVRGEWQRYSNVGGGNVLKTDVDLLGLSVLWMF